MTHYSFSVSFCIRLEYNWKPEEISIKLLYIICHFNKNIEIERNDVYSFNRSQEKDQIKDFAERKIFDSTIVRKMKFITISMQKRLIPNGFFFNNNKEVLNSKVFLHSTSFLVQVLVQKN